MDRISYNLCFVLNKDETKLLMGFRSKNPYKGLYNLLGGKIEQDEDPLLSAYRELEEESGISRKDITLIPFMDYIWHPLNMEMKVYIGKLDTDVQLVEELHKLYWIDISKNFYDMNMFAGEGNIGHMVEIYKQTKDKLFGGRYE
jgi:8-oxo-dGTP diphosphatase